MYKAIRKTATRCPTADELSEFVDGFDREHEAAISAHLETCSRCRESVAVYRQIAALLKLRCNEAVPEGLADRIKDAVDDSCAAKHGWTIRYPTIIGMLVRVAAVLTVGSAVLFYLMTQKDASNSAPPPVVAVISSPATESVRDGGGSYNYYPPSSEPLVGGGIPLNSLVGASYGETPQPIFTEAAGNAVVLRNPPASIEESVRQVWAVANLQTVEKALLGFGARVGMKGDGFRVENNGTRLLFNAVLPKIELVKLVRECRAAGFELLSPEAPQPEQNLFCGKSSDSVNYQAEFVQDAR